MMSGVPVFEAARGAREHSHPQNAEARKIRDRPARDQARRNTSSVKAKEGGGRSGGRQEGNVNVAHGFLLWR
jgi:hypothetical protein